MKSMLLIVFCAWLTTTCHARFEGVERPCDLDETNAGCLDIKCDDCDGGVVDLRDENEKLTGQLKAANEQLAKLTTNIELCENQLHQTVELRHKQEQMRDQCIGEGGVFSSESDKCYISTHEIVGSWMEAWNDCESRQFQGVKGRLAQPATRYECTLLTNHTSTMGWNEWFYAGGRTQFWNEHSFYENQFYYPNSEHAKANQTSDRLIGDQLWYPGEPNNGGHSQWQNDENCVAHWLTGLYDISCKRPNCSFFCQFEMKKM